MFDFAEYWRTKHANREEFPLAPIEQLMDELHIPASILTDHTEPLTSTGANCESVAPPVSPGELIQKALDHIQLNQAELAKQMGVSRSLAHQMIHNQRSITIDNAIQLESILRIPAHVLLRLQADYDLYRALRQSPITDPIAPHSRI